MTERKHLIDCWLKISILSLGISGVYSIFLVLLRSPYINQFLPHNLFKQALIVHVNLSTLFWILSITISNLFTDIPLKYKSLLHYLSKGAVLSIIIIAMSAFVPDSLNILCNYIPIIQNILFFIGLSLFLTIVLIICCIYLRSVDFKTLPLNLNNYINVLSILVSFVGFFLSAKGMNNYLANNDIEIEEFYELIFWGGGHLLQFSFIHIMCISWINLTKHLIKQKYQSLFTLILSLNFLFQIIGIWGYTFYINDPSHKLFFTTHMKHFAGIMPAILAVILLSVTLKNNKFKDFKIMFFVCSLSLFILGGVISFHIRGNNVTVPAHYHGSIVGVTLALMGLTMLYIEEYKLSTLNKKLSFIQPLLYTCGQFIHILGLNWSGGYGVLRKSPGETLSLQSKIAMSFMGIGGLIAIFGGFLFIWLCYQSLYSQNK